MESMYSLDLKLIYALDFFFSLASALVSIAIPLFAYSLGASQLEIGVLGFAHMGIQIPLCVYFGRLSDRAGRTRLLMLSVLCASAALTLLTVSGSLLLLFVVRLILGFASSIFYPVSGALTADRAPAGKMVKVMGLSSLFYGVAWAIGPVVSGYLIDYFRSYFATFLLGAIFTFTMYPLIISLSRRRGRGQEAGVRSRKESLVTEASGAHQAKRSILAWAFVGVSLQGFILGVIFNIFPVYSVIIGFSEAETGLFSAIANMMSILVFFFIGRLSDRLTKLNICILGAAFCVTVVMVPLARDFVPMAFSIAMVGLGAAIIYPTSKAAVLELSMVKRGSYIGLYESVSVGGMSAGSLLGGTLASYVALEAPYYFISAMAVAVVLFLSLFARRNDIKS
ncbi:MAG TPA: MFS transporter [Candidatus Bathyarchaeia archaeon]|nr:MFS transporter [Candidatus Bathyarchaeia archaeon]